MSHNMLIYIEEVGKEQHMEVVYGWVKNLVCFYIFITAVLHLLPKESYRKYVRFFTGLLLAILVLTPVLSLFGNRENLYEKIEQMGFFQEMENLKLDTAYLEASQQKIYQEEYEKAICMDIEQMAKRQELQAKKVEVSLTEECLVKHIYIETAFISEDSAKQKAAFAKGAEYPQVYELQKELAKFYQVDEEEIEIVVKE